MSESRACGDQVRFNGVVEEIQKDCSYTRYVCERILDVDYSKPTLSLF